MPFEKMPTRELSLIDKNITSLLDIPLSPDVSSLSLHCNHLSQIEGLSAARHILHLDLSSNHITHIQGLASLTSLRTLNLSCNMLAKVEGLEGLVDLVKLNLSYNQISDLTGLQDLRGHEYKLKRLHLQCNRLQNMSQLLECLRGLKRLRHVDGRGNPLCAAAGYRELLLQCLPQVTVLDGIDRLGNLVLPECTADIPGMEELAELLLSSDVSVSKEQVPHINCVPCAALPTLNPQKQEDTDGIVHTQHQQSEPQINKLKHQVSPLLQQAKRDIDHTSESEGNFGKRCFTRGIPRKSRIPKCRRSTSTCRILKACSSESSGTPGTKGKPKEELNVARTSPPPVPNATDKTMSPPAGGDTYKAIIQERDLERERRWKAEQTINELTQQVISLQRQASKEQDLQSRALHTTDRLKALLLKERLAHVQLQEKVEVLQEREWAIQQELAESCGREEETRRAMQSLQDSMAQEEAVRARQQAEEMKRQQVCESKAVVLRKELDLLRAATQQHKDKMQALHELLACREEAHRKDLQLRVLPGGPEFHETVARELSAAEQRHSQQKSSLEEKVLTLQQKYAALEDEFRTALIVETSRYAELKECFGQQHSELADCRLALTSHQQKEEQRAGLVKELTSMVKEQKGHIAKLMKSKHDAVSRLKTQLQPLQAVSLEHQQQEVQMELLKQDRAQLLSQVAALESVVEGLRAERKMWGQELALQGASLAQDRGRLEAHIEALSNELQAQKKQNESDQGALKIRAKIVEDQTETIRKLKEGLLARDERIRQMQEEAKQTGRQFESRLHEETALQSGLRDRLKQISTHNEELKQQLEDRESDLEEIKSTHSIMIKKWQDKAELLSHLEAQVKCVKEGYDAKERELVEEKERALQRHKLGVEKLHTIQASHQEELLQLRSTKQKEIDSANHRVLQVEDEMRQILEETEHSKQRMEEKIKRLTNVLKDFDK